MNVPATSPGKVHRKQGRETIEFIAASSSLDCERAEKPWRQRNLKGSKAIRILRQAMDLNDLSGAAPSIETCDFSDPSQAKQRRSPELNSANWVTSGPFLGSSNAVFIVSCELTIEVSDVGTQTD
jgi:hypothetical protein